MLTGSHQLNPIGRQIPEKRPQDSVEPDVLSMKIDINEHL